MIDQQKRSAIRTDFDRLLNMSAEEMTTHYASPESDYASLHPVIAAKLNQKSGKTLGKTALGLKGKKQWEAEDYDLAEQLLRPLRLQLTRKAATVREDGTLTPFGIALMNRGHDPRKANDGARGKIDSPQITTSADAAQQTSAQVVPQAEQPAADAAVAVAEGISVDDMTQRLDKALDQLYRDMFGGEYPDEVSRPWVEYGQIYPLEAQPKFIFRWEGTSYSMHFTMSGAQFIIDPDSIVAVHREWVPDEITPEEEAPTGLTMSVTEAEGETGPKWHGVMIRAGEATNPAENGKKRVYTEEALREGVEAGLFDDLPGYQRTDAEHSKEEGGMLAGTWGKAAWDAVKKEVQNTFTWLKDKYPSVIHKRVVRAVTEGKVDDIPGFSITANVYIDKKTPHIVRAFKEVRSCDPISFPSAGGRVIAVTESHITEQSTMKILDYLKNRGLTVPAKFAKEWAEVSVQEAAAADFLLAQLKEKRPKMFERDPQLEATLTKNELLLVNLFSEFMASEGLDPAPVEGAGTEDAGSTDTAVTEADRAALTLVHRQAYDGVLANSRLDEVQRASLRKRFDGRPFDAKFAEQAVQEALEMQTAYGKSKPQPRIDVQRDGTDKAQQMANDFFCSQITDLSVREAINTNAGSQVLSKTAHGSPRSLRQLYIDLTGDTRLELTNAAVRESIDPSLVAKILANAANLRILQDFQMPTEYDFWRELADVNSLSDFKSQTVMRMGHFGSLKKVGRDDAYEELAQGAETNESYTPDTYGGMISIHRKDIINDNVGAIMRMPTMVTMDAKMDLSAFAWSLILDNPTLGDGKALFHSDHNNLISDTTANAGLTDDHFLALEAKLRSQKFPGRDDVAALPARYAIIPSALRKTAYAVFTAAYGLNNATPTFLQSLQIKVMECVHASAAKDYYVVTDKMFCPVLELGFYQGREVPELLVADNETAGALFTHDKIQWKVRHEYGGSVVDYRGIAKAHITD